MSLKTLGPVIGALVLRLASGATSAGSCYNMTSHSVSCDVAESSCNGANMYYAPGYVSPRSGCCHCRASCPSENVSDSCTYYDAETTQEESWGCYDSSVHRCDCGVSEAGCTAKGTGHSWTSGCRSCVSQGSCYNMTTHSVSCDVAETSCSSPNAWYAPGYVSPRSGCCHCRASCPSENVSDSCTYYDAETTQEESWGCYDSSVHRCDCGVSEAGCTAKGTGHSWTSGCGSCASQGSCYDMTTHSVNCDVAETSCSSPNTWYAPGYVSPRSGCCHCRASCAETAENCTYYDDPPERETPTERWGCYDSSTRRCDCSVAESACTGTWTRSCSSCDDATTDTSSAGSRPKGIMVALLVFLSSFLFAEAGTGCYNVETHQCDCTVTEAQCLARRNTWTDGCRSCDATTNTHHPQCQKQYSWGCFDEPSHACECTVSERACDNAPNKSWTHECWSCCHGSAWGCFVPGSGPESGCHCDIYEGACELDFSDATWSHQCFECEEDAEQTQTPQNGGDGTAIAIAVSVSVTFLVMVLSIGIYCLYKRMSQKKPVNEPYNSPPINDSADVVVGRAVPGTSAPKQTV